MYFFYLLGSNLKSSDIFLPSLASNNANVIKNGSGWKGKQKKWINSLEAELNWIKLDTGTGPLRSVLGAVYPPKPVQIG